MQNSVEYNGQSKVEKRIVLYSGAGNLLRGQGMCYDDADQTSVLVAVAGYNNAFAGVCTRDYTGDARGQLIEIACPGSVIEVALGSNTTLSYSTPQFLCCSAGAGDGGRFTELVTGFNPRRGRGIARVLETKTALIGSSLDGTATVTNTGLTVTKTGMFAGAVAGDFVYILGGNSGTVVATPGKYTIASVTSNDVAVLSSACAAAGTIYVACYVVSGNPVAQCELLDGEESGLTEVLTAITTAAAQSMVGGVSFITGGYTIAGDCTCTLANGKVKGMEKVFYVLGALTTGNYVVTVTAGIKPDRATDLNTITADTAGHLILLTWHGAQWLADWSAGCTLT